MLRFKRLLRDIQSLLYGMFFEVRWFVNKINKQIGVNDSRKEEIIVSLTSFPARIKLVQNTIRSILLQELKPDKVELWLAEEQFPHKEEDLPLDLLGLKDFGLDIRWCRDIKSYKKLIPALIAHPKSIIVTADDDVYYDKKWLLKLVSAYSKNPQYIYCHKATKFSYYSGKFHAKGGGKDFYNKPCYLNKLVGVGGVLYPPNSLYKDICDNERFTSLAPTNDDIWFWLMAVLNEYKICVVKKNVPKPVGVFQYKKTPTLTEINDHGNMLFWKDFECVLEYYPKAKEMLIKEQNEINQRG